MVTPESSPPRRSRGCPSRLGYILPVVALVCALCLPVPPVSASLPDKSKLDYALIVGTVWSPEGKPIYGVKVIIRRADATKGGWQRISDHMGEFAVRVPTGTADYVVRTVIKAPKDGKQAEVKVHIDNNERVEVGLHLGK